MAGFFGIGDFTKEGKGVDKNAPKKRGIFAFFELFFRKFWKLVKLNMLYILACIPTLIVMFFVSGFVANMIMSPAAPMIAGVSDMASVDWNNAEFLKTWATINLVVRVVCCLLFTVLWGMGPVTAGYTYILRNYAREEHAWMLSDFWQHTKENFKQAIVVFLVDVVAFVLLFFAYIFYSRANGIMSVLKYLIVSIAFIYTAMHFYIYPIMVTIKQPLKDIYRNAFLFAIAKLPINVFVLAVLIFIHLGIPVLGVFGYLGGQMPIFWVIFVALELLLLISTSGFIVNFSAYPAIKKYLIMAAEVEPKRDYSDEDAE